MVRGRVHGVFYRAGCRDQALARGVAGWVRNRRDGTVEAVFEGGPAAVEALRRWCLRGPAGARVSGIDVFDEPVEGLSGFIIEPR